MGKNQIKPSVAWTTRTLIIGAISFVTALAWRDLAKKIFEINFGKRTSLKKYVLYTMVVTISAIIIVYCLSVFIPKRKYKN